MVKANPDIKIDPEHIMVISPDLGGMKRAVYYAGALGVEMGLFYKRMDYSKLVDGEHPVVSTQFLGNNVSGKDILLIDDMIATGHTILDVARELKERGANRIFICVTFGLFSNGTAELDAAYDENIFDSIYTTNLSYCPDEVKNKPYYHSVDLSKYISAIIDTLNHDTSVNDLIDATQRIQDIVQKHNNK